ncbi:MAG: right-handed parallel beta-helix repeat-containing protein [Promethearchaeota archaeon]
MIGNYWSDYPGSDLNDDDIGDIPYNKNGIIDYLPIWDDGDSIKPIIIINSPQDGTYCDEVPLINVSVFDANLDQIWYTVSNNTTKVLLQNNIEVYLDDTIWGNLPNGPFKIYFNANDSAGNTDNKNLTLYKHVGIWTLSPFIIDDLGNGDYTWLEASIQGWCRGSGTSSDPYIIKNIIIDSQNSGSCIEIKNSDAYVVVRNSTFSNSGIGVTDAGIRLDSSSNVKLLYDETSINNGYGIYLSYCQDILIEGCTINDNAKSGIMLYESDNNIIRNNTNTINSNSEYGIYLNASHSNQISGNTINYNLIGICFDSSSYNNITFNDLRFNSQHAILETGGSTGNFFDGNDPPIIPEGEGPSGIPLMFIYLIICVSIIAVVVVIGVVIAKKRSAIPKVDKKEKKREKERLKEEERLNKERLKEKQRLEKERLEKEKAIQKVEAKERRIEQDLQKSLLLVDNLIKENKIEQALRDLVEIQKEAQAQGLIDIVNKAEENIILCKKSKVDTVNRVKQTILTLGKKFTRLQLVDISETSGIKDQSLIESIIHNMIRNKEIHGQYFSTSQALALEAATAVPLEEKAKGLNVFISYSTLDTDYFQVSKIVRRLELYPEINEVLFWEVDSKQNIVEFMEETLNKSKAFVLFCSENSIKSDAVKGEWQSAYQMVKKGLMKIIPVYEDEDHIPKLLWQMLNVKFTPDDFEGFIQKLYEEILR